MFWTAIRGGKTFSAEQKIRELKKRIFRLKSLEKSCQKKAKTTRDNLKRCQKHEQFTLKKCIIKPEELEQKHLGSEAYRERFDSRRLEKNLKEHSRLTR